MKVLSETVIHNLLLGFVTQQLLILWRGTQFQWELYPGGHKSRMLRVAGWRKSSAPWSLLYPGGAFQAHKSLHKPSGLFPGLLPNTALNAGGSGGACQRSASVRGDGSTDEFPCPFRVCLLYMAVTARWKLTLFEFGMLNLNFVKKRFHNTSDNTSIRISGAANQNIGSLLQQEKPTAVYQFIALACYNILGLKRL